MIDTIIYTSNTGYTEKYAKMLSEATGIKAYRIKDAPKKGCVIYLGWIHAGNVKGLKDVIGNNTIACVCGVGMSPQTDDMKLKLKKSNKISEGTEVFYLQGGLDLSKLSVTDRLIMKAITSATCKKLREKEKLTESEEHTLSMTEGEHDTVSKENLEPVIAWVKDYLNY